MKVIREFNYRNAKEIIEQLYPSIIKEIYNILNNSENKIKLDKGTDKQRELSKPIQDLFLKIKGWKDEQSVFSIPDLKYDLLKSNIPIEIEIAHERGVYGDFFKFLSDYSNSYIPAAIMIVTNDPNSWGHKWHNSFDKIKKKIESISKFYLVPVLVIGIDP